MATTGLSVNQRDEENGSALIVDMVVPKSSASRAGLQEGVEILRFNGIKRSAEQIQKILANVNFGEPITIAVIQNGEERTFRFHAE